MNTENRSTQELANLLTDLKILSVQAFSFRDAAPTYLQTPNQAQQLGTQFGPQFGMQSPHPCQVLADAIRDQLYTQYYVRGVPPEEVAPPQNLLAQLQGANATRDRWDPGWKIYQMQPNGNLLVQKGERSRAAAVGEYASNKWPGATMQVGDVVNLRVFPGSADMQQGFYFAFSDTLPDQFDEFSLLRFYFNLRASGAPALLSALSRNLNRYQISFRFKTLTEASSYQRADAAVLYVAKRDFSLVREVLLTLAPAWQEFLRAEIPMFCTQLLPGIGMAEEPGNGESFGMHRCRLVAEGVVDAWLGGTQELVARLEAVRQRFAGAGITPTRPYLNAHSIDSFISTPFRGGLVV